MIGKPEGGIATGDGDGTENEDRSGRKKTEWKRKIEWEEEDRMERGKTEVGKKRQKIKNNTVMQFLHGSCGRITSFSVVHEYLF